MLLLVALFRAIRTLWLAKCLERQGVEALATPGDSETYCMTHLRVLLLMPGTLCCVALFRAIRTLWLAKCLEEQGIEALGALGSAGRLQWESQLEPLFLKWVHSLNSIVSVLL